MAKAKKTKAHETLRSLSEGDLGVGAQLNRMLEGSFEESGLDPQSFMLVRMAALIALDAAPASWWANLVVGTELGVDPEFAVSTLIAVAPIVGTARVVSAAGSIVEALEAAEEMSKEEEIHRVPAYHHG